MDIDRQARAQELARETVFKDAVIKGAEAKAAAIVQAAEARAKQELEDARRTCDEASHETVTASAEKANRRETGQMEYDARRELLRYRAGLVEGLFGKVEAGIDAFTAGPEYAGWLQRRLAAYKEVLAAAKAPVLYLREADMPHAAALQSAAPGCKAEASEDIRFGGFLLSDGTRLYNETLDALLAAEKDNFYETSGLSL